MAVMTNPLVLIHTSVAFFPLFCIGYSGLIMRLNDGVHAFYINALLRALTMALVSIFVPLFVYQQALRIWGTMQLGLLAVVSYYFLQRLIVLVMSIPISKIIERIGFRRSIAISIFLLILNMASLVLAKQYPILIVAATIFMGLNIPMYWVARDSALSQDTPSRDMGKDMGGIAALEQIAALSGPFVAGVIIERFGFSILFTVALVILVVSVIPLWWMPHHAHKNGVTLAGFFWWVTSRRYFHQSVALIGASMQDYGLSVLWPLALFFAGIKIGALGIIFSAVMIVRVGFQYGVGTWFDRMRKRGGVGDEIAYAFSTISSALLWLVRLFVSGIWAVVLVDSISQGFQSIYYGFQANYAHMGGKRMGSIAYWVYSQMIYSVAALGLFAIMAIGVWYGVWKELTFVTIALWVLASIVQGRESSLK